MSDRSLVYDRLEGADEGVRETLCTLGDGHFATRGASARATADGTHYPGTYLAGGCNRLKSEIQGHEIENEDLVNIPNWLPLLFRIGDGPWLRPSETERLEERRELSLRDGVLIWTARLRDAEGRVTRREERRPVSMADPHVGAIELKLTAENWSGALTLRSAIDGGVINAGVPRYGAMNSRHLETLERVQTDAETVLLRSRMVQSRREIVLAARTRVTGGGNAERSLERLPDLIGQDIALKLEEGAALRVEKVVALHTSTDHAISEPALAATGRLASAGGFEAILDAHRRAWETPWEESGIELETSEDSDVRLHLRLHIFHILQTNSIHSRDMDVGIPPRGWTGEACRGHIMWDELFVFPFLNLRKPELTRALPQYRHRRLDAAREAAREAGLRGAMFPWQSGSDGREESQTLHLNPRSGRWVPDTSNRQRHVNAAIAYNVRQYDEVTHDRDFLSEIGAELMAEIARFWASLADCDPETGSWSIRGVMGPDEFHTACPGRDR